MKKITAGQAGVLMFLSFCSSKFLTMPSAISAMVGRDIWVVATFAFILETIPIYFILKFMQKYPDKNLKQVLEKMTGKILTKIIIIFYAITFFIKLVILSKEIHNFLIDALYDRVTWDLYLIPVLLIMGYVTFLGLRSICRTSQIFIYVIVFALIVACSIGLMSADITNTLPIMQNGFGVVFHGTIKHLFNFSDSIILLIFLGNVKPEPKMAKKIGFGIGSAMIITIIFYIIFNAVYDNLSLGNRQGIANIAQFIPNISSVLRLDWFTTIIWIVVVLLKFSTLMYCVYVCLLDSFGLKNNGYVLIGIGVAVYLISIIPTLNIELTAKIFYSTPFTIMGLVQYVIPYAFSIFLIIMKKDQKKLKRNKINGLLISEACKNV
ncbi:MAG: GerAB/ArcD/ProY family transporter [Clostridia bacterium]|jgi:spore germination protein KB|nr:spore germination protein [Clostridia bacterium]MDD4275525.1 GerAB/ArcD/ProY family transporter [Clostridia bacterium]